MKKGEHGLGPGESQENWRAPEKHAVETEPTAAQLVERFILDRQGTEPSVERQAELNEQLIAVTDFFQEAGIEPYIAGGSAVDLLRGDWSRDHQDLDMAIFGGDREKFYTAAIQSGFKIHSPSRAGEESHQLTLKEIQDPATHNAFLARQNEHDTTRFEVMFLNEAENGDVQLTKQAVIPRIAYEQAPTVMIEGREIALTPPEVTLFYKLTDGRRKDFQDAIKLWETLSPEQRSQTQAYLEAARVTFMVQGQEVTQIPELFKAATPVEALKHQDFFGDTLTNLDIELNKDLMQSCEEVFLVKVDIRDRSQFLAATLEKYQDASPDRREALEAVADFLYQQPAPTLEQFKTWSKQYLRTDELLKRKALQAYQSEKIWDTQFESSY